MGELTSRVTLRAERRRAPVGVTQGGPHGRIDIGVHRSDRRARAGKLTRRGTRTAAAVLGWSAKPASKVLPRTE